MLLSVQSGDEKEIIFEDEERDKLVKYLSESIKFYRCNLRTRVHDVDIQNMQLT